MARPLRIELPGALYHATSRRHHDEPIYDDEQDRKRFLEILAEVVERFDWRCYAYCQMTNHYHLVFKTMDANLSAGMRYLNGVYTQASNRRHGRTGPVFNGRYKTVVVDARRYFLPLCRYIVLNPVRAGIAPTPEAWRWSSYRATAGIEPAPDWLATASLLEHFSPHQLEAQARYRDFVNEGVGERGFWKNIRQQLYLGDDDFVRAMQAACDIPEHPGISREQRRPPAPSLGEIAASAATRNDALVEAYKTGAYSYTDLARHFGLHPGSIGRIIRRTLQQPN